MRLAYSESGRPHPTLRESRGPARILTLTAQQGDQGRLDSRRCCSLHLPRRECDPSKDTLDVLHQVRGLDPPPRTRRLAASRGYRKTPFRPVEVDLVPAARSTTRLGDRPGPTILPYGAAESLPGKAAAPARRRRARTATSLTPGPETKIILPAPAPNCKPSKREFPQEVGHARGDPSVAPRELDCCPSAQRPTTCSAGTS